VPEDPFRDRAAIVGVGATPYSRDSGVSTLTMALHAITDALADAGLHRDDVDGAGVEQMASALDREIRDAVPDVTEVFLDATPGDGR